MNIESIPTPPAKRADLDKFLMHYGVLGMKWGVRKQRETSPKSNKSKQIVKSGAFRSYNRQEYKNLKLKAASGDKLAKSEVDKIKINKAMIVVAGIISTGILVKEIKDIRKNGF